MIPYRSFCGIPVSVRDKRLALVAFHGAPNAFDDAFIRAAELTAERCGRDIERRSLRDTRRNEVAMASFGMALASLAHELASDLTALDANLADVQDTLVSGRSNAKAESASLLGLVRAHVEEMTSKTLVLRGARPRNEETLVIECLRKAAVAARTVIAETIQHPERIDIAIVNMTASGWRVSAPPASLMMVFFNLYLNAAQQIALATPVRTFGRVWHSLDSVTDARGNAWIRVRIHDTGPGIHRDDWERVFDAGYTTKPGGSGLGLYICRHLLRDVAGRIEVTRSNIWDGTTMTAVLPLA